MSINMSPQDNIGQSLDNADDAYLWPLTNSHLIAHKIKQRMRGHVLHDALLYLRWHIQASTADDLPATTVSVSLRLLSAVLSYLVLHVLHILHVLHVLHHIKNNLVRHYFECVSVGSHPKIISDERIEETICKRSIGLDLFFFGESLSWLSWPLSVRKKENGFWICKENFRFDFIWGSADRTLLGGRWWSDEAVWSLFFQTHASCWRGVLRDERCMTPSRNLSPPRILYLIIPWQLTRSVFGDCCPLYVFDVFVIRNK